MTCRIRLCLAIHNHQPIGNFEDVFESAYQDSYAPFLDILDDYPDIPVSLHTSGSLMEWLVAAHRDYVDRLGELVQRGQIEILGGPFYEPILSGIPARDRVGQISAYSAYLKELLGMEIRGMWVPERVWEQAFAGDIRRAGIEYTILDDYHFRNAGLNEEQLQGYYITEDDGWLLNVFPGSERLRYTIPFAEPHVSIEYLRHIAERSPNTVVTLGDDGEKFGTWPGTKKHVYEDGWLRRFFDMLRNNSDWLKVATLSEAVDSIAPTGRCYLPDCSYREMTEWVLPTDRQLTYSHLVRRKQSEPDWHELKQFIRGGIWRNFRVKYSEANEMYARMLEVSRRVEAAGDELAEQATLLNRARTELYRGQCNCSYWHGAFGGLYLPHLRNAVYRNLIAADSLLEQAGGRTGRWVEIDADDYNLDARKEVRLAGDRLIGYLAPSRGGHLYELDVRSTRHNLLATLNRRPEPYHEVVREAAQLHGDHGARVSSIHETIAFKQPDLDKKLTYDAWPRKSLVDHFLQPGLTLEEFQTGLGQVGDFVNGVYETRLRRSQQRVEAHMARSGRAGPHAVRLSKTVALDASKGGRLEIEYELEDVPVDAPIHFGVEFNFAGMAAGAADRYYYDAGGRQLGQLESVHSLEATNRIGLIDEWLGLDAALEMSQPGGIWTFPVETISQSEGGFELVHQSCAVVPHWEIAAPPDGRWSVKLVIAVDTSAAQARQLRETKIEVG